MEKKYMLTDETKVIDGRTLHRVKALKDFGEVKAGDLGGFIEREENLSQEGNAWVGDYAKAFKKARIYGNAQIGGNAQISDNVQIYDNARIFGSVQICGEAQIYEYALVYGSNWIYGNAQIFGSALIHGDAEIHDDAQIYGNALISGNAVIRGKAQVYGSACISGNAWVCNNAKIYDHARIYGNAYICDNAVVSQDQHVSYGVVKTDLSKPENLADSIKAQCNLPVIDNKVVAYKLVRPDLTSFYDGIFQYEAGKEAKVENCEESNESCASGLHFSNITYWNLACKELEYVCLEAEIDLNDIITVQEGKIRCRKAKVLRAFTFD